MDDVGRSEETAVRSSGYVSSFQELWYGVATPVYDAMLRFWMAPLGGERACREWIVRCVDARDGHDVLSLCCGTGTTDRVLHEMVPRARITGIDLGAGQIATARRKDRSGSIRYRVGDASSTGIPGASFDRVLIGLALHEMPRALRLAVLREARRLCRPDGRVVAVEHAPMPPGASRALRSLWWGTWIPGNPERATTLDLQRHGLAREMTEAGLAVTGRETTRPAWIEAVSARSP